MESNNRTSSTTVDEMSKENNPTNVISPSAEDEAGAKLAAMQVDSTAELEGPESKKQKKEDGPDPEAISKYITTDLWSDNATVVGKALGNISDLLADDLEKYEKPIVSLAGHMMILAALKKHILVKDIIEDAIGSLHDLAVPGPVVEALRSAGTIDVVIKAIHVDSKNPSTVQWGFELLETLIRNSYESALEFNNTKVLDDGPHVTGTGNCTCHHGAYGLVEKCMNDFELGNLCSHPDCPGCQGANKSKNRVHLAAIDLIFALSQHVDLRYMIIHTGCAMEVMKVLQAICTVVPIKPVIEWKCMTILKNVGSYDIKESKQFRYGDRCEAAEGTQEEKEAEGESDAATQPSKEDEGTEGAMSF